MTSPRAGSPPLPRWVAATEAVAHRVPSAMALASGAGFLFLAFYITYDVLGRHYGFAYSGVTDEMSGYVLAFAGTWGLAHALRIGAHVRIDLLLPLVPRRPRAWLDMTNTALIGLFAGMLAWYSWLSALESLDIDARGIGLLQAPLALPQALMATGLTALAVEAALLIVVAVAHYRAGDLPGGDDPSIDDADGVRGI
jgi:TRAP-type C4-dicarboxylate transport system permease small subunit